jgi:hypothetical protein
VPTGVHAHALLSCPDARRLLRGACGA